MKAMILREPRPAKENPLSLADLPLPERIYHFAEGILSLKEIEYLGRALENPRRPFVAILGGGKIIRKIDVITHLLPRVDRIIIGGPMTGSALKGAPALPSFAIVRSLRKCVLLYGTLF